MLRSLVACRFRPGGRRRLRRRRIWLILTDGAPASYHNGEQHSDNTTNPSPSNHYPPPNTKRCSLDAPRSQSVASTSQLHQAGSVTETSPVCNSVQPFISPYAKNNNNARKPSSCEYNTTSTISPPT